MAQIQIDKELFMELCKYHLGDLRSPEREQRIKDGLNRKLDKAAAREKYMGNRTDKSF